MATIPYTLKVPTERESPYIDFRIYPPVDARDVYRIYAGKLYDVDRVFAMFGLFAALTTTVAVADRHIRMTHKRKQNQCSSNRAGPIVASKSESWSMNPIIVHNGSAKLDTYASGISSGGFVIDGVEDWIELDVMGAQAGDLLYFQLSFEYLNRKLGLFSRSEKW